MAEEWGQAKQWSQCFEKKTFAVLTPACFSLTIAGRHFEPSFETAFTPSADGYDFQIRLKAFKSDPKTLTQINRSGQDLPVMEFDAVHMFLEELRACYSTKWAVFDYGAISCCKN